MSISEIKKKILEVLWEAAKPMKPREVAQQIGLGVPASTMHLLGLKKTGHVSSPERGYYSITDRGKEAIGLPRIEKKQVLQILGSVPVEKAFHFYTGIDKYLGVYARSLNEFCDIIQKIDPKSVEFHVPRRDFEFWFLGLGDSELAKRMNLIGKAELSGENLRKQIYDVVKSRCEELKSLSQAAHHI